MKILLLDIETAPNLVHVWGLYQQNVGINQIQASGYVLCWAAKWYGDKKVMFRAINTAGAKKMLEEIHALVDQADVVVHYNGTKFDMPTLNKEFITYGMQPPSPYKQVDLIKTTRSQFKFPSNKLDYVTQALKLGKKVRHTGHELWTKCMMGDRKAWKEMEEYNRQDVVLLERLYEKLLPWIKSHPNHGTYADPPGNVCPNCGGHKLQRRGYARSLVNKYARYHCQDCGTWSKEALSEFNTQDRQAILRKDN